MAKKVNLNTAPALKEILMFGVIIMGIIVAFIRYFYNPQTDVNKLAKDQLAKIKPNYEAFLKLEKSPTANNTQAVQNTPIIVGKDNFQQKTFDNFSSPPKLKETQVAELNQKLVARDLLKSLSLDDISFNQEIIKDDFSEFNFNLVLSGGYMSLLEVIQHIMNQPLLVGIQQLSLQNNQSKNKSLTLQLQGILYVPVPGQKTNKTENNNSKDGAKPK